MSAPALLERLIGGFAYFIPTGSVVDTLTISPTVKPDASPTTNWTNFYLGSVISAKHEVETADNSFQKASPSGGFEKVRRVKVLSDAIVMKTREMGEPQLRLQYGLSGAIVEDTAQTPFASTDRRIDGWLKVHYRQEDGTDMAIMDVWCSMELVNGLTAEGKTTEPELRFTVIKSVSGVAVAGNTIVFPAVA
jgi:hypothetical protein